MRSRAIRCDHTEPCEPRAHLKTESHPRSGTEQPHRPRKAFPQVPAGSPEAQAIPGTPSRLRAFRGFLTVECGAWLLRFAVTLCDGRGVESELRAVLTLDSSVRHRQRTYIHLPSSSLRRLRMAAARWDAPPRVLRVMYIVSQGELPWSVPGEFCSGTREQPLTSMMSMLAAL